MENKIMEIVKKEFIVMNVKKVLIDIVAMILTVVTGVGGYHYWWYNTHTDLLVYIGWYMLISVAIIFAIWMVAIEINKKTQDKTISYLERKIRNIRKLYSRR